MEQLRGLVPQAIDVLRTDIERGDSLSAIRILRLIRVGREAGE